MREVPSPRGGGGAQEGQDLARLDPAVWLELEQLLDTEGARRGAATGGERDAQEGLHGTCLCWCSGEIGRAHV